MEHPGDQIHETRATNSKKRILQIHTAITFGLLLLLMVGRSGAGTLVISGIALLWFFKLIRRIRRRNIFVKFLTVLIAVSVMLVLFSTLQSFLGVSFTGFALITKWLMVFGAIIPFLMFFSLFVLYPVYGKKTKNKNSHEKTL